MIWRDAASYFTTQTKWGGSTSEIQSNIKAEFDKAGAYLLVSAFGSTEFPTSAGSDPTQCANSLADFVRNNHLHGADLDWEDNDAMNRGLGEQWLITFQLALRANLGCDYIITHAPQAPYFKEEYYKNGAYMNFHRAAGEGVNFYNVQFYNQVDSTYDTYDKLFITGVGGFDKTAVLEIVARGVPLNMLVVGKPVRTADATNTGWVDMTTLASYGAKAHQDFGWCTGYMFWQLSSDPTGAAMQLLTAPLADCP